MSSSANGDHIVKVMTRSAGTSEQPTLIGPIIPIGLIKYTDVLIRTSVMLTFRSHFQTMCRFYVVYLTLLCHDYPSPAGGHRHGRYLVFPESCSGLCSFARSQDSQSFCCDAGGHRFARCEHCSPSIGGNAVALPPLGDHPTAHADLGGHILAQGPEFDDGAK
jgi:hypothetical protein